MGPSLREHQMNSFRFSIIELMAITFITCAYFAMAIVPSDVSSFAAELLTLAFVIVCIIGSCLPSFENRWSAFAALAVVIVLDRSSANGGDVIQFIRGYWADL